MRFDSMVQKAVIDIWSLDWSDGAQLTMSVETLDAKSFQIVGLMDRLSGPIKRVKARLVPFPTSLPS